MSLAVVLAAASGCLVFLSFPNFNLFPLQWVSLVPLLVAARGRGLRGGLFLGFITGIVTNVGGFYWISDLLRDFGHLGMVPSIGLMVVVAAYQAVPNAVATGLSAMVASRMGQAWWFVAFPLLFTATEFLVPFIFPWYFANGQQGFHAVTQIVEFAGVSGLTFLLVTVNCGVAAIVCNRLSGGPFPVLRIAVSLALLVSSVSYGLVRIRDVDRLVRESTKTRISMVEADVGIWEKEAQGPDGSPLPWAEQVRMLYGNLLKHQFLTARVEREATPDLIIWPESSYIPLHAVMYRGTDAFAIGAGPGRIEWIGADGTRPLDGDGASAMGPTGLRDLSAAHEDLVFAVGARGAVFSFDGRAWKREPTGTDRDLYAVAAGRDGLEAMAVGSQGTALVRKGRRWRPVELGTAADLNDVTWAGDQGFAVCGDLGTLLTWDGRNAARIVSGTDARLLGISWAPPAGIIAVGDSGTAVRVNGHGTTGIKTGTSATLRGAAAGEVTWIAGDGGLVLACKEQCSLIRSGTREDILDICGDGRDRAWAAGNKGSVIGLGPGGAESLHRSSDGPLRTISWVPFREGYPLPRAVRRLYASEVDLPDGNADNPGPAADIDRGVPARERNTALRGFSTPLLFGAITYEGRPGHDGEIDYYNTALLAAPDGEVLGRYDKNHLLPFGEYIPFADWFPFLKRWLPEAGDYMPGRTVEVFDFDSMRIGLLICYEDIIPGFVRKLAEKGPNVLVNITNDAWFGHTSEPYQHLQLATFRAIENRLFLLRSTNTGVSAVVDPVGRVVQHTSLDDAEVITADIAVLPGGTPYQQFGDLFAWACCALSALFVTSSLYRRK